jgi:hypothetical protein
MADGGDDHSGDMCANHRKHSLSIDEYRREAKVHADLLAETLNFMEHTSFPQSELLKALLCDVGVFLGLEDLDMDCAVLRLPNTPSGKVHLQAYMWDWLAGHTIEERAARIAGELLTLFEQGKLVPRAVQQRDEADEARDD